MLFSKRFRWAWLVCLLLLAGFLVNSISSYLVSREHVRRTIAESSLPLTSDNVYSEIQRDLLRPIFLSSLMAHDTFLRDWAINGETDEQAITHYLQEIKDKYDTITSFFVSERSRNYYYAQGLLKQVKEDEPRDEWYFRVRRMTEPYEINVDPDLANADETTIFINYRVLDYEGTFIGTTGVGLTVNSVNRLISHYEAKYHRQIYFTDTEGKIVLRPSNSPMLHYQSLQEIDGLAEHVESLLNSTTGSVSYTRDGETRLLHCRYVPELKWFLIVEQSDQAMLAPFRQQLLFNLFLALTITISVAAICRATIRKNQSYLEKRNQKLTEINKRNEEQKRELELASDELQQANLTLQALNKEKDEFIGIIAHDLRNPLNGILGLCEIYEMESTEREKTQYIAEIQECGERMLNLTRTLLDADRIEDFQGEVEMEEVAVNAVVERAVSHFAGPAQRKHIKFGINLEQTEDLSIKTNPNWLAICMDNLASNSVKYTQPYGSVEIRSRTKADGIEVAFTDTGPGLSDEDRKQMFGKFVRLSARPTGNESSIGLGLYVVKKMCDRLGIQIGIESQLGKGATFTLHIPLGPEQPTPPPEHGI